MLVQIASYVAGRGFQVSKPAMALSGGSIEAARKPTCSKNSNPRGLIKFILIASLIIIYVFSPECLVHLLLWSTEYPPPASQQLSVTSLPDSKYRTPSFGAPNALRGGIY